MPNRAKKFCEKPNCKQLTTKGRYCDKHKKDSTKRKNKKYDRNIRKKRDKKFHNFYMSDVWRKVKNQALARDFYLCQECKKVGIVEFADVVHHKIELKQDWSKRFALDNLVSLCHFHHNMIHHKNE